MSNILVHFCKEADIWEYALEIKKISHTIFGFKYNTQERTLEAFFTDLRVKEWAYIDVVQECDIIPVVVLEAFERASDGEGPVIKVPNNVRVIGAKRPAPATLQQPAPAQHAIANREDAQVVDSDKEQEEQTLAKRRKELRKAAAKQHVENDENGDEDDSNDEDYEGEEDEDDNDDEESTDTGEEEVEAPRKRGVGKGKTGKQCERSEEVIEYELGEDDEVDDARASKKKPLSAMMVARREFSQMCETGRLSKKYRDMFKKLPPHRSREYLSGKSMYYAIPSDRDKGNSKAMCCLYKLDTFADVTHTEMKCYSKHVNPKTGMLNSDFARFLYAAHLGNMDIRRMKVDDAFIALKSRSICTKCKTNYRPSVSVDRTLFYDIFDSRDLCAICKRHCTTSRVGSGIKFMVCSTCFDKCSEKNSEWGLYKTMSTLQNIFEDYVFVMHDNAQKNNSFWVLNDDEQLQLYYVDFYMTVQIGELTLLVIIEQDEQEHMGQQKDDNIKMKTQSAYLLAKLVQGDRTNIRNIRVVMIRFNPYSGSGSNVGGGSGADEGYDRFSRLVILRQWIIFAITHVEELRTLSMWYMWYTPSRSHTLLYGNAFKEVFGAIYQAPKPRNEHEEWMYCFDPYEGDNRSRGKHEKKYRKIIEGRVPVEEIMPSWRKEKEANNMLPNDFEIIYTRQLKLIENPQAYQNRGQEQGSDDDVKPRQKGKKAKTGAKGKKSGK